MKKLMFLTMCVMSFNAFSSAQLRCTNTATGATYNMDLTDDVTNSYHSYLHIYTRYNDVRDDSSALSRSSSMLEFIEGESGDNYRKFNGYDREGRVVDVNLYIPTLKIEDTKKLISADATIKAEVSYEQTKERTKEGYMKLAKASLECKLQ